MPRRTNVVARVPGRNPDKPALVLHGHLDVVPADRRGLERRPVRRRDPRRDAVGPRRRRHEGHGRDDPHLGRRHPAARATLPERDLVLAFFADEENGGGEGRRELARRDRHPESFAGATEAISEVGGYSITVGGERAYLLQMGEKALIWIRLVARGVAAPRLPRCIRDNAVTQARRGRRARSAAPSGRCASPTPPASCSPRIADTLGVDPEQVAPDELAVATGSASGFIRATLRTTTNPTELERRLQAQRDPRPRRGAHRRPHAARARRTRRSPTSARSSATTSRSRSSTATSASRSARRGPLVDAVARSLGAHDPGAPVIPYLIAGGTDNKALAALGIAGYGFAPLRLPADLDFTGMFHGVDERVPLDALVFGRTVLTDLLLDY